MGIGDFEVDLSYNTIKSLKRPNLLSLCSASCKAFLVYNKLVHSLKDKLKTDELTEDLIKELIKELDTSITTTKDHFEKYVESLSKDPDTESLDALSQKINEEGSTGTNKNVTFNLSGNESLRYDDETLDIDEANLKTDNLNSLTKEQLIDRVTILASYVEKTTAKYHEIQLTCYTLRSNIADLRQKANDSFQKLTSAWQANDMFSKDIDRLESELNSARAARDDIANSLINVKNKYNDLFKLYNNARTAENNYEFDISKNVNNNVFQKQSEELKTPVLDQTEYSISSLRNSYSNKHDKLHGIETFKGNPSEIELWIQKVDIAFDLGDIPEHKKVKLAFLYTKDLAADLLLDFYKQKLPWNEAKKRLLDQFKPADYQASLLRSLSNLKHTNNLTQYTTSFKRIANKMNDVPEPVKMNMNEYFILELLY